MFIDIKKDPNFSRLRKTLLLQGKADRVPLFDFHIDKSIKERVIGHPILTAEDEIEFWISAGYDYVQVRLVPKAVRTEAPKSETPKTTVSLSTSHGTVNSIEQLNEADFEWTPFVRNTWKPEDYNYDFFKKLVEKLPEEMKLIVHAADIFTRSWMAMGFEDFCYALYENPELIEELFRQNAIEEIKMLEVLVESFGNRIGAILYSDDLAYTEGLMLPLNVYRRYLWPHFKVIADMAKRLDAPIIFHTDGRLWEVFDDFAEMGVNGLQPLEPKAMDLKELKQKRGHQFCLIGSIDVDILSRGKPQEVEEMVCERIGMLGCNGGYIVGTSNTVPYYVNPDNYKAMIEATFKYGKYL